MTKPKKKRPKGLTYKKTVTSKKEKIIPVKEEDSKTSESIEEKNLLESILSNSNAAKENIISHISEVSDSSPEVVIIPVGNEIEESIIKENNPEEKQPETEKSEAASDGEKKKERRGRKLGGHNKQKEGGTIPPKVDKILDPILATIEGMLMPIMAKRFHKEYKDLILSKDQRENIRSVTPENNWMRPSWPLYGLMTISFYSMNYFQAKEDEQTREFKALEKRMSEKNDSFEKKMESMLNNTRKFSPPESDKS